MLVGWPMSGWYLRVCSVVLLAALASGCGVQVEPVAFPPPADAIPKGPGLITGESGAFAYEIRSPFLDQPTANEAWGDSLPRPAERPPYTTRAHNAPDP